MKNLGSKSCLFLFLLTPLGLLATTANENEMERFVDPRAGFEISSQEENGFIGQTRIIGGSNSQEGRYPYMVSLIDANDKHTCGGSLVAPDMVLTAAHCQGATRRAHVGRWNRQDSNDNYDDIAIQYPEFPHPEYSLDGFANDFMLVLLEGQSSKQTIPLNANADIPRGNTEDEVTVIGFGNTISGVTSLADVLQEVDVTYIPNSICELSKDSSLDLSYQNQIVDSMLCAGDSGQDSCQGDSGGPLLFRGGSADQDVQVGIISWYVPNVCDEALGLEFDLRLCRYN